jgi:hypothetical protein
MRARLVPAFTAVKCLTLLALGFAAAMAVVLAPVVWLLGTTWMRNDLEFVRFLGLLEVVIFWFVVTSVSLHAIRVIRLKTRSPRPCVAELSPERQPLAAELTRFLEVSIPRLRGNMRVCLTLAPSVCFLRDARRGKWQICLGLPAIALLTLEEIQVMALRQAFENLRPVTPLHPWLGRVHHRACVWQNALPPHPGALSLTHNLLHFVAKVLNPVSVQQHAWSSAQVAPQTSPKILSSAGTKIIPALRYLMPYLTIYRSALRAGGMPPFAEGFSRLVRKAEASRQIELTPATPCFTLVENLWVYERQLTKWLVGEDCARDSKLVGWDDFSDALATDGWKKTAALLRPVLGGKHTADIPDLVTGWHALARRSMGVNIRKFTPDVQKGVVLQSLASVFAMMLVNAGWKLTSALGEDFSLRKDDRELRPFRLIKDLASGALPAPEFIRTCREASTADLPLA